jgi:aminopeptidase YwaD
MRFILLFLAISPLLVANADVRERSLLNERIEAAIRKEASGLNGNSPASDDEWRSIADAVSDSTITEYVTRLVGFQTRYSCTDSNWAAGQWIHDKFLEYGFTDVSFDSFPLESFPCEVQRNMVAVKPGIRNPEKVVIIGGHYDSHTSPGSGCDPDTLAPGADDDASGTAVLLESARLLAETDTDVTLIFIAFGGEEQGLIGSQHYAEEAFNQGMDIKLMFNLDCVAHTLDDTWDVDLWADSAALSYAQVVAEMAGSYTDLIPHVQEGTWAGDNEPFYWHGYSFVYASETDRSPHWHQCTDTIDNMSLPYLTDVARMIVPSIQYVSDFPIIPSGFTAINADDGTTLYLSWSPNSEPDLAGYYVYYGTQPGVYDTIRTVTSEYDTLRNLIDGTTYYLALSAFDLDDHESFLTEDIEIETTSIPSTPTGITSTSLVNAIVIDWNANEELDLVGYNLYRWEVYGPPDTVLHASLDTATTTYADDRAEPHVLYGYHVTAVDSQVPANESSPSESVLGRLATHDRGILLVDCTWDGSGGPFSPTDQDVDAFYDDILRSYNVQAVWDSYDSIAGGRPLKDYDAGEYSTILWHNDVRGFVQAEETDTTTMRVFLDTGGNLWLLGWRLVSFLTGRDEVYYVFGEDDFVSRYVGIDSVRTTSSADRDFIGSESLVQGFPPISVDSALVYPIGTLYNMEILLPPFSKAQPLYAYVSSDSADSEYHGLPVAVVSGSQEYGLVFTDFPLYFMEREGARLLAEAVMAMFGETVGIGEGESPRLPQTFSLSQNSPNPFNPSTTIRYEIPALGGEAGGERTAVGVRLEIFDIRGHIVRKLVDGEMQPGRYEAHWDGRDEPGGLVGTGVYFYRIQAGGFVSTRKMVLVR